MGSGLSGVEYGFRCEGESMSLRLRVWRSLGFGCLGFASSPWDSWLGRLGIATKVRGAGNA